MAKLEATLHGNFSAILNAIDTAVLEGSFTASLETRATSRAARAGVYCGSMSGTAPWAATG